jgi:hypothetical protein
MCQKNTLISNFWLNTILCHLGNPDMGTFFPVEGEKYFYYVKKIAIPPPTNFDPRYGGAWGYMRDSPLGSPWRLHSFRKVGLSEPHLVLDSPQTSKNHGRLDRPIRWLMAEKNWFEKSVDFNKRVTKS